MTQHLELETERAAMTERLAQSEELVNTLAQRLSEVEAERGQFRQALVLALGMGDGVTRDEQIVATVLDWEDELSSLRADQERMREALQPYLGHRIGCAVDGLRLMLPAGYSPDNHANGLCDCGLIAALSTPRQPCVWRKSESSEYWATTCGKVFTFSPRQREKDERFCGYCGAPLTVVPRQEPT